MSRDGRGLDPHALQATTSAWRVSISKSIVGHDAIVNEEHVTAFEPKLNDVFGRGQKGVERVECEQLVIIGKDSLYAPLSRGFARLALVDISDGD